MADPNFTPTAQLNGTDITRDVLLVQDNSPYAGATMASILDNLSPADKIVNGVATNGPEY